VRPDCPGLAANTQVAVARPRPGLIGLGRRGWFRVVTDSSQTFGCCYNVYRSRSRRAGVSCLHLAYKMILSWALLAAEVPLSGGNGVGDTGIEPVASSV
jgi:hypothetical protein